MVIKYRTISPAVWVDEKFNKLSEPAQRLYLYLLTGPVTTNIPGVVSVGINGLVEKCKRSPEIIKSALSEMSALGMIRHDLLAPLIIFENAVIYNAISPQQVKGWANSWRELPNCRLKYALWHHLHRWCVATDKRLDEESKAAVKNGSKKKLRETSHAREFLAHCHKPQIEDAADFDEYFSEANKCKLLNCTHRSSAEMAAETMRIYAAENAARYPMAYPMPYPMAYKEQEQEQEQEQEFRQGKIASLINGVNSGGES